jgi:hypothetical protein
LQHDASTDHQDNIETQATPLSPAVLTHSLDEQPSASPVSAEGNPAGQPLDLDALADAAPVEIEITYDADATGASSEWDDPAQESNVEGPFEDPPAQPPHDGAELQTPAQETPTNHPPKLETTETPHLANGLANPDADTPQIQTNKIPIDSRPHEPLDSDELLIDFDIVSQESAIEGHPAVEAPGHAESNTELSSPATDATLPPSAPPVEAVKKRSLTRPLPLPSEFISSFIETTPTSDSAIVRALELERFRVPIIETDEIEIDLQSLGDGEPAGTQETAIDITSVEADPDSAAPLAPSDDLMDFDLSIAEPDPLSSTPAPESVSAAEFEPAPESISGPSADIALDAQIEPLPVSALTTPSSAQEEVTMPSEGMATLEIALIAELEESSAPATSSSAMADHPPYLGEPNESSENTMGTGSPPLLAHVANAAQFDDPNHLSHSQGDLLSLQEQVFGRNGAMNDLAAFTNVDDPLYLESLNRTQSISSTGSFDVITADSITKTNEIWLDAHETTEVSDHEEESDHDQEALPNAQGPTEDDASILEASVPLPASDPGEGVALEAVDASLAAMQDSNATSSDSDELRPEDQSTTDLVQVAPAEASDTQEGTDNDTAISGTQSEFTEQPEGSPQSQAEEHHATAAEPNQNGASVKLIVEKAKANDGPKPATLAGDWQNAAEAQLVQKRADTGQFQIPELRLKFQESVVIAPSFEKPQYPEPDGHYTPSQPRTAVHRHPPWVDYYAYFSELAREALAMPDQQKKPAPPQQKASAPREKVAPKEAAAPPPSQAPIVDTQVATPTANPPPVPDSIEAAPRPTPPAAETDLRAASSGSDPVSSSPEATEAVAEWPAPPIEATGRPLEAAHAQPEAVPDPSIMKSVDHGRAPEPLRPDEAAAATLDSPESVDPEALAEPLENQDDESSQAAIDPPGFAGVSWADAVNNPTDTET